MTKSNGKTLSKTLTNVVGFGGTTGRGLPLEEAPREVIRAMVEVLKPQVGQTVYDPCCGTGGFLAQAFERPGVRGVRGQRSPYSLLLT